MTPISSPKMSANFDLFNAWGSVPLVGNFVTFFNEIVLSKEIHELNRAKVSKENLANAERMIRLIEMKNFLKVGSLFREIFIGIILVTLIGANVLHGTIPLAMGGVGLSILILLCSFYLHCIADNKQDIGRLKKAVEAMKIQTKNDEFMISYLLGKSENTK